MSMIQSIKRKTLQNYITNQTYLTAFVNSLIWNILTTRVVSSRAEKTVTILTPSSLLVKTLIVGVHLQSVFDSMMRLGNLCRFV